MSEAIAIHATDRLKHAINTYMPLDPDDNERQIGVTGIVLGGEHSWGVDIEYRFAREGADTLVLPGPMVAECTEDGDCIDGIALYNPLTEEYVARAYAAAAVDGHDGHAEALFVWLFPDDTSQLRSFQLLRRDDKDAAAKWLRDRISECLGKHSATVSE